MNGGSLLLGQYYAAKSPLHTLDPRIKLSIVIGIIVAVFFVNDLVVLGASVLIVPLLARIAKLPYRWILKGLRPIVFILVFTFFIHLFFTPGPSVAVIGPLTATSLGLRRGAFYTLRLILIILLSSFVTLTTTPVQLIQAIESLLRPLKKVRFPVHETALTITIALRFIPILLNEAENIIKAQKARGADFESGHIFRRAKNFIPLLIPLFVGALRRADELALAMEARGYPGGDGRTRLRVLKITATDMVWFVSGLVVIGLLAGSAWVV